MRKSHIFYSVVGICLLFVPYLSQTQAVRGFMPGGMSGPALMHVFILIFFFAYMSQAWNIIGGFAGQLSIGHAAFFGMGAYVSTLLFINIGLSPWLGMLVSAAFAAVVGAGLGAISFHYGLKGPFFSLITIAFTEIVRLILLHWDYVGGTLGILIPLRPASFVEFQFANKEVYFYIAFIMMLASIALVAFIARSRFGYYLHAVRQDEDAAEAVGVPTKRVKIMAIALSAGLAGAGGTFYAQYTQYIVPDDLVIGRISVEILLPAVIGGAGTVMGPIIGSFILIPLGEITRIIFGSGGTGVSLTSILTSDKPGFEIFSDYLGYLASGGGGGLAVMLYGIVLMVVVLGMPNGVLPWLRRLARKKS